VEIAGGLDNLLALPFWHLILAAPICAVSRARDGCPDPETTDLGRSCVIVRSSFVYLAERRIVASAGHVLACMIAALACVCRGLEASPAPCGRSGPDAEAEAGGRRRFSCSCCGERQFHRFTLPRSGRQSQAKMAGADVPARLVINHGPSSARPAVLHLPNPQPRLAVASALPALCLLFASA
jgi:hypothetical protein